MKYEVMGENCIVSGECVKLAPGYFESSEDDGVALATQAEVAAADEGLLSEVAKRCPVSAILLTR